MQMLINAMLVVFAVIHLLPLPGVLGGAQLQRLYSISLTDPDMLIMMRHRALLFGLLAMFALLAVFRRDLQWLAIGAGLISAGSFVVIAWLVGGYGGAISRVVVADVIAVGCLLVAAACRTAMS